jgi:hypothetical protein
MKITSLVPLLDPGANKPRRSKTRKVLLTVLPLLVAAPVAFLLFEHYRGKRMLAVTLEELRTRGEVLEITRLAPPPVPAVSNGLDRLTAAVDALRPGIGSGPPSMQTVGPARVIAGSRVERWVAYDGTPHSWSGVAGWIQTNAPWFDELHTALAAPYRRPVVDYSQGFDTVLPYLSPLKAAVAHLGVAALEAAQRGDFDRALAELEGMRQIERDLVELPLLIDQLVRIACAAITNERAWDILHAQEWSEPQLAKLQSVLTPIDLIGGVVHAYQGERALALGVIQNGKGAELWSFGQPPPELSQDPSATRQWTRGLGTLAGKIWRFAWSDQAAAHFLDAMQALIDASRAAAREQSASALGRFQLEPLLAADSFLPRARTVYARGFLPALGKAPIKALRCETERALLVTGIALRRFQLRYSHYPERLSELVPEFLSALPIDRMDGQPVRYRLNPDHSFTLWSIGEDLVDQGGDPTLTRRPGQRAPPWWQALDAVWPTSASEEEMETWLQGEAKLIEQYEELMRERYGVIPGKSVTNAPGPPD